MQTFKILLVVAWLGSFGNVAAWSQDNLENIIERDAVAFLTINDPGAVLQELMQSPLLEHHSVQKALEVMHDDQFQLLTANQLAQLSDGISMIESTFNDLDQISLVIHSIANPARPKWSVIFTGTKPQLDALEVRLSAIVSILGREILPGEEQEEPNEPFEPPRRDDVVDQEPRPTHTDELAIEPSAKRRTIDDLTEEELHELNDADFLTSINSGLSRMLVRRADNVVLLSSSPRDAEQLIRRIDDPKLKFRSLGNHRAYRRVQAVLDESDDSPDVRAYINPEKSRDFMLSIIAPQLSDFSFQWKPSLVAGGFQLSLHAADETVATSTGDYRPTLQWGYVLIPQLPLGNFGDLFNAFGPLGDLPPLPYDVLQLTAETVKPDRQLSAYRSIVRQPRNNSPPHGNRKNEQEPHSENGGIDGSQQDSGSDASPRPQPLENLYGIYWEEEDLNLEDISQASDTSVNVMIQDASDIENFGVGTLEFKSVANPDAMKNLFDMYQRGNQIGIEKDAQMTVMETDFGYRIGHSKAAFRKYKRLTPPSVQEMRALVTGVGADRYQLPLPYDYFLDDDWLLFASRPAVDKYISACQDGNSVSGTFEALLSDARNRLPADSFFKVSFTSHRYYQSGDYLSFEILRQMDKAFDYNKLNRTIRSQPDRFGLRQPIESKADAVAAVKTLLMHSVFETYGTTIQLHYNDDDKLKIFGVAYAYRPSDGD